MGISDLFFGAKIAESAVNKVRGRGKAVDRNVLGSKTTRQNNKVEDAESLDDIFDYIAKELPEYVLEQNDYLTGLCLAFKRPHISTQTKSFKNMVFVCGPEGSGRKYAVRVLAKLLMIKKLEKESTIYYLDFSQYASDDLVEKLALPDLYKAFYGHSPIVIIENYDRACTKAREYISNLGINGVLKLNKRYVWKNGTFSEATGSMELKTTDSISANGKNIVLVSSQSPDNLSRLFPRRFLEGISDILTTKELSETALCEIARAQLHDCSNDLMKRNGIQLVYEEMVPDFVLSLNVKHGAHDVVDAVRKYVYDPIIERALRSEYQRGDQVVLSLQDGGLYGNGISLARIKTDDNTEALQKLDRELSEVIGLQNVKDFIEKLRKHIEFEKRTNRSAKGMSLHMIFCGNPGTGKTTIARLVARYLKELGCLSSGHLVEVTRGDLVGQYLGQTAPKTAEKIRSALGGVLFIDEAYSLSRNKEDFFGVEAIDTLVKYMEDYREDLVVILAGYTDEMTEFLEINSGLRSRFNYIVDFPDYSPEELLEISEITARKQHYQIDESCRAGLLKHYSDAQRRSQKDAGNGRLVRNTIEKAILNHSQRLADLPPENEFQENQTILLPEDFNLVSGCADDEISKLDQELSGIIGLDSVKDFISKLKKSIEFEQKSGIENRIALHMVFCGNPGTGKTSIARIVAKYLRALRILSKGHLVEVSRADLVAGYAGQTAIKTNTAIEKAIGGVLFIDEAYSLVRDAQDSFGLEAVDTLVKGMEDHRDDLVVILAGYTKEMNIFMKSNSGLRSRFNYTVEFPDYSAEELIQIADVIAETKQFHIDPACREALTEYFRKQQNSSKKDAGNGRLVRNLIEAAILNHAQRVVDTDADSLSQSDLRLLTAQDFGLIEEKRLDYDLEAELGSITGLESVKEFMRSLYAVLRVNKARKEMGIPVEDSQSLHMIFTGNPGTGKTTMARIVAKILFEMGILPSSKLIETDRSSLVAGYVGQTAEKTLSVLEEACGGVLFVDEAYALASGGEQDFGREAIDTMVKYMEDHRSEIVIILAGYTQDMKQFLSMNPGLISRFPNIIEFPNYTAEELLDIIKGMYSARHYVLGPGTEEKLLHIFNREKSSPDFGNGRFARNLCEKSIRNLSLRITRDMLFTKEALTTITPEDITI